MLIINGLILTVNSYILMVIFLNSLTLVLNDKKQVV